MTRTWTGVVCDYERSRIATLSWFKPMVPDAWGLPIKADCQEDAETGRETALRALFRLPDGRLKEAYRTLGGRSTKLTLRDASPGILKGWRDAAKSSPSDGAS